MVVDGNGTYKCYVEEVIVHPNCCMTILVGGLNLFEKYVCQMSEIGSFPQDSG